MERQGHRPHGRDRGLYYIGTGRDTENDHKIYRLLAVLADSKQDLRLPSCSAGNGTVIKRSARTAAGILKFTGTAHFRDTAGSASADRLGCTVTVITTCCSLQPVTVVTTFASAIVSGARNGIRKQTKRTLGTHGHTFVFGRTDDSK